MKDYKKKTEHLNGLKGELESEEDKLAGLQTVLTDKTGERDDAVTAFNEAETSWTEAIAHE